MTDPPPAKAPAPAPAAPLQPQHEEREQNILKSLEALFKKYEGDLGKVFDRCESLSLQRGVPIFLAVRPPLRSGITMQKKRERPKPTREEVDGIELQRCCDSEVVFILGWISKTTHTKGTAASLSIDLLSGSNFFLRNGTYIIHTVSKPVLSLYARCAAFSFV